MKIFNKTKIKMLGMLFVLLLLFTNIAAAQDLHTVTIKQTNATIDAILMEIQKQTSISFAYNVNDLQSMPRITINETDRSVSQILDKIFADSQFSYTLEGNKVTIVRRNVQSLQLRDVTGTVTDTQGAPVVGATVAIRDLMIGTTTDIQGRYMLRGVPENVVIRFSFIGMEDVEKESGALTVLNVTMRESLTSISEVTVVSTGLVDHNKNSFTGNATVVQGDELRRMGRHNLIKSLSLIDPSLQIVENNEAGSNPNAMPKLRFRGESSFQGFENLDKTGLVSDPNQPMFVLDGFQTTLQTVLDLDMNRVESITILKDAAATAIYGSSAANGVIVVKTIAPKEGEMKVSYTVDLDFSFPDLSTYDLLNARENLELFDRFGMHRDEYGIPRNSYNVITSLVARGVETDWLSQPVRNSVGHKHSLSLSGGDRRMRYNLSTNYSDVQGVMKKSLRTNMGLSTSLQYNLNDRLLFRNDLSINKNKAQESPYGSFHDYTLMNAFLPIYNDNGKMIRRYDEVYGGAGYFTSAHYNPVNPLAEATAGNFQKSDYVQLSENFSVEWKFADDWRLTGRVSYSLTDARDKSFLSPMSTTYNDNQLGTVIDETDRGEYTFTSTKSEAVSGNMILRYSNEFGKHFVTGSIGGDLKQNASEIYGFTAQGFGDKDRAEVAFAKGYKEGGLPNNVRGKTRQASLFVAVNYSYDSRYMADFTYRLDGSSQFGNNSKSAPFWSVGIGWNVHDEKFFQGVEFIERLKIRASIGETGSVSFAPYQSRDMYSLIKGSRYDGNTGATLIAMGNENLRWQSTMNREVGFDISLLGRFDITASYYDNLTSDMVLPVTSPPSMGFSSFTDNLGKMQNRGYELSLRATILKTTDLSFVAYGSAVHNSNKIKSISSALESFNKNSDAQGADQSESDYKAASHKFYVRYTEGESSTAIYAVRSLGIDPMTGQEFFLTADGVSTLEWSADNKVVVGDSEADLRGTLGLSASWKGFYLNLAFSYQIGGQAYNQTIVDKVENSNKYYNVDKRVLTDTWQKPGDDVSLKANQSQYYILNYTYASSRFVQDLNTLQLSSISLQYEMPKQWVQWLHMQSLRLSFNMNDVFYLSSVKRERGTSYPFARSFTMGLRTNF